ncbi:hypothetical protein PIROE2DRAFT_11903 [Piromyces sp. E2]|nr:hypothetical protein PIROE2DRAFT_11903 [Piromyces sp. E2]|eukprot:OUM61938.1 hypothetical protein PIROE2DRAFT_11903 [Piromyces sp. E2]
MSLILSIENCSLALSTFIDKGLRPELFELTDNEVAVFRVTLPEEEYSLFKTKANIGNVINNKFNITEHLYLQIRGFVEFLAHFHYTEIYPGYNFTEILPELNIDENGYAHIDTTEIMTSLNITKEGLLTLDFSDKSVHGTIDNKAYELLNKRNPNFNITRIKETLDSLVPDEKYRTNNNNNNTNTNNNNNNSDDEIFKTKNGNMIVELDG